MNDRPLQRKRCRNCRRLEGPFINRPDGPFDRHSEVHRYFAMNPNLHVNPLTSLCSDCARLLESIGGGVKSIPFSEHLACIEYGCERCGGRFPWERHLRECSPTEYIVSNGVAPEQSESMIPPWASPESWTYLSPIIKGLSSHRSTVNPSAPAARAPISRALRNQIYARDGYTCQQCGAKKGERGVQLVIDHKKPVKRGGTNGPSNLQTLCSLCNSKKGARNTGYGDIARDSVDES